MKDLAQAVIDLNNSDWAALQFRYADPNKYHPARIGADTGSDSGRVTCFTSSETLNSVE